MMPSENPDPQLQPENSSQNASDDTQSSTTTSAALTKTTGQSSTMTALTGIDQYNDMDENGDNAKNTENNTENQEETDEAAAEQVLDNYISKEDPREASQEIPHGTSNKAEDTDSEEEEVELASGVTPSYEKVNGEHLSLSLKRKQRMDEILQQEDGDSELEDEQMTDVDQEELDQESASAPIPEGLCVECRDQVIGILSELIYVLSEVYILT
jgi:hypothetical protein